MRKIDPEGKYKLARCCQWFPGACEGQPLSRAALLDRLKKWGIRPEIEQGTGHKYLTGKQLLSLVSLYVTVPRKVATETVLERRKRVEEAMAYARERLQSKPKGRKAS